MGNIAILYHGGSVDIDDWRNFFFVGMQSKYVLFSDRSSFIELVARSREELLCEANEDDIIVEGVFHKIQNFITRHMFSIASKDQWQNHVRSWLEFLVLLKLSVT